MAFEICEVQNVNSTRRGYFPKTSNLSVAKGIATRNRVYRGTVLTIRSQETGRMLAYRRDDASWVDCGEQ
jgi:hypothetical protein